jgi:hypothetical protein
MTQRIKPRLYTAEQVMDIVDRTLRGALTFQKVTAGQGTPAEAIEIFCSNQCRHFNGRAIGICTKQVCPLWTNRPWQRRELTMQGRK